MATIITTNRVIKVNEDFDLISEQLHRDWVVLSEIIIYENRNYEEIRDDRRIKINTSHIIEVQP